VSPVAAITASGSLAAVQARIEMLEQRLGIRRPASTDVASAAGTSGAGAAGAGGAGGAGAVSADPVSPSFGATLDGVLTGDGNDLMTAVTELLGGGTALPGTATAATTGAGGSAGSFDAAFDAAVARLRAGWSGAVPVGAMPGTSATPVAAAAGGVTGTPGIAGSVSPATPYASLFEEAGARHGIPPKVLAAVGWVESRFRLEAVSSAGALGMMQFLPSTAAGMGVDPWDPASAIDGAARYLRHALDRFGSLEEAIAAYNVGPGAIARAGGVQPGTQAERYLQKVLEATGRV
jgi:hypothetical protein